MKPSERIKEIHIHLDLTADPFAKLMGFDDTFKKAILIYLDEEWEKKQDFQEKHQLDLNDPTKGTIMS